MAVTTDVLVPQHHSVPMDKFHREKSFQRKMKSLPFALNRADGVQYQRAPPAAAAPPARGTC